MYYSFRRIFWLYITSDIPHPAADITIFIPSFMGIICFKLNGTSILPHRPRLLNRMDTDTDTDVSRRDTDTDMDERQRGNPAAVACQGGLGLLGFRAPLSPTPWSFSSWLSRQRGTLCMTNSSSVALRAPPTLGVSTLCLLTGWMCPQVGFCSSVSYVWHTHALKTFSYIYIYTFVCLLMYI